MAKNMQRWDGEEYAMMGWRGICNNGMAALIMQRWNGEEYATMGWRGICNDGMAALIMQRWDGEEYATRNMQQWDGCTNYATMGWQH